MVPEHPSIQTLLVSMDAEILKTAKYVWPEMAYRTNLGLLGPLQEAVDAPTAILPHGLIPPQLVLKGGVGQVTKRRPIDRAIGVENVTFLS